MAAKVRDIKISWENGVNIKVSTRLDGSTWLTVVDVDENGHLPKLWDGIKSVLTKFFDVELDVIGTEMNA